MAKRIKLGRVLKWALATGTIGIPAILLFGFLVSLGSIDITAYSGDSFCEGTIDDPCIALINFTANEDIFIYPNESWSGGLYTDLPVKQVKMFRSWGKGWREIKLNETCKGTWCGGGRTGAKYSFAFREGRDYQIKFEALKYYPHDKIKWGFADIDPLWDGNNYTLETDRVFINDSKIFLSAEPHTTSGGPVYFNLISRVYEGNADIMFGFDTSQIKPKKAFLKISNNSIIEESYTCDTEFFNYTLSPKHAWCFRNVSSYDNQTMINSSYSEEIFNHSFDRGNLSAQTIYWNVTSDSSWKDISSKFSVKKYDYEGMNTWYLLKNINLIANKSYELKVELDIQFFVDSNSSRKYWVAIKPSSETIQQAIANGNFYTLDPWWTDLNAGLISYWNFDEPSGNLLDQISSNDGTNSNLVQGVTGKIGDAYTYSSTTSHTDVAGSVIETDFSISMWVKPVWDGGAATGGEFFFDSTSDGRYLFYKTSTADRYGLFVGGTQIIDPWTITDIFTAGVWSHLVITADTLNDEYKLYINGTQVGGTQTTATTANPPTTLHLGNRQSFDSGIDADMDEIGIWNRSLSDAEVLLLWRNGAGRVLPATQVTWTDALNVDLVSYYALDESSGNPQDSHGSNHATSNTGTANSAGKINTAYAYDNQYSGIPDDTSIQFSNVISMSCWCSFTSLTDWNQIITKRDDPTTQYEFRVDTSGKLNFLYRDATVLNQWIQTTASMSTGTFFHIVFVWEANTEMTVYIDGSEVAGSFTTGDGVDNMAANTIPVTIGGNYDANAHAGLFKGTVDELGLWNRSLRGYEISDLYNGGLGLTFVPTVTICSPTVDEDWIITDAQSCDGVEVDIGTGNIIFTDTAISNLTLINGANVTVSGINAIKDASPRHYVFIDGGSELRIG